MKRSQSTQSPRASAGRITLLDVLAARREHQQRLAVVGHRLVQQQLAQRFAERRAAGLAGRDHAHARAPRRAAASQRDVRALAGAVDAFERDEAAGARVMAAWGRRRDGEAETAAIAFRAVSAAPSWYFATARLCSARFAENSLRAVAARDEIEVRRRAADSRTASSAAWPGSAIGVGGRPSRV